MGSWLNKYRHEHGADEEPGLDVTERARLRKLERENQELRADASSQKSDRILRKGVRVAAKYEFLDSYASTPNASAVLKICRWVEVSRSGFYHWRSARSRPQRPAGVL